MPMQATHTTMLVALASAATLATNTDSCVSMENKQGIYVTPLSIGTPYQTVDVAVDTGSYDLLLASTLCQQPSCRKHARFDPEASSSFELTTVNGDALAATLRYGQGEAVAVLGRDRVGLGTVSPPDVAEGAASPAGSAEGAASVTVTSEVDAMDMLLMQSNQLKDFGVSEYDGVMGLGKRNITDTAQRALLSRLAVDSFSVCLGPIGLDGTMGLGGRLDLGSGLPGLDFVPLKSVGQQAWASPLTFIGPHRGRTSMTGRAEAVRASAAGAATCSAGGGCGAIIDSGTTLLTLPQQVYDSVMGAIDAHCPLESCLNTIATRETCDGQHFDALPALELELGGRSLSLLPSAYMAPVDVSIPAYARLGPFYFATYVEGIRCVPLL